MWFEERSEWEKNIPNTIITWHWNRDDEQSWIRKNIRGTVTKQQLAKLTTFFSIEFWIIYKNIYKIFSIYFLNSLYFPRNFCLLFLFPIYTNMNYLGSSSIRHIIGFFPSLVTYKEFLCTYIHTNDDTWNIYSIYIYINKQIYVSCKTFFYIFVFNDNCPLIYIARLLHVS